MSAIDGRIPRDAWGEIATTDTPYVPISPRWKPNEARAQHGPRWHGALGERERELRDFLPWTLCQARWHRSARKGGECAPTEIEKKSGRGTSPDRASP
jgi:hypothetical protein